MGDRGERIRLPGGGEVLVRPVEPEDQETLRAGFERLGERSRYLRFLAPKHALTAREIAYLTDVDHVDHEAIGALDAATGEGVGVARYIRLPDRPSHAEAAVAVVDEWQGRGLGGILLERLVARAKANGVAHFCATLLVVNHAIGTCSSGWARSPSSGRATARWTSTWSSPCRATRSGSRCARRRAGG